MRIKLLLLVFFTSIAIAIPEKLSLPEKYLPLPLIRQKTDYSCGPAVFLSVLRYWGLFAGEEEDLYAPLKTTEKNGTHSTEILRVAKEMKLNASMAEGVTIETLKTSFNQGETVILDLQAWRDDPKIPWKEIWKDGHYIILVGMDNENLYAMDPLIDNTYGYLPLNELYERWHDYEEEDGKEVKNNQLAIFMKGVTPGKPFPVSSELVRID